MTPDASKTELPDPCPGTVRRYLALWFPYLSTDKFKLAARKSSDGRDEVPLVLVDREWGGLQVTALNSVAANNGLRFGMTLADAYVLLPELKVAETDQVADKRLLLALAGACERVSPLVALDGTHGVLVDITGCAHLFGGERGLMMQLCRRFESAGVTQRASIASTPDAAHAAARFGRLAIVTPGKEAQVARSLPVAALEQGAETTTALIRAGLKTLGDLIDRPAHTLSARFGAGLVTKLRCITGQEERRLTSLRPLPDCQATRIFPEPMLEMLAIEAVLADLAQDICRMLAERGLGGRCFEAGFFRSDGAVRRIAIETVAACRDVSAILRLMRLKLDTLVDPVDPGFGFDAFRLSVPRAEPLAEHQISLDGRAERETDVTALIDRLVVRFGRSQVQRFVARDSHNPRMSAARVPAASDAPSAPWPEPEPGNPPTRPLTLFTPPQLIEALAEIPDGPPMRFRWRRVMHNVARAEGPERIAPEWWLEGNDAPTRDYYRIEDVFGHRFWIFREGFFEDPNAPPRWFLHGLFA